MPLSPDNLSYPVKITFKTGECGSGFLLEYNNEKLFLITAKHVLYKKYDNNELILCGDFITIFAKDIDLSKNNPIKIDVNLSKVKVNVSEVADICVVLLADLNKGDNQSGGKINFHEGVKLFDPLANNTFVTVSNSNLIFFDKIHPSSDIFVLGYPVSIGISDKPQIDYDQPLVRKGIVAGKNHKNKTIILDCPVYPGNSGGLAVQPNTVDGQLYGIIGIVTEFIPYLEIMISLQHGYKNHNLENSGYSVLIPTDHILHLVNSSLKI